MKKSIYIDLYLSELLHDIRVKAYHLSEVAKASNQLDLGDLIGDTEDEFTCQLLRSIQSSFALLRHHLNEYVEENDSPSSNNILMRETIGQPSTDLVFGLQGKAAEPEEEEQVDNTLRLALRVPSNFNYAVKDDITTQAHCYLVNQALRDWLRNLQKEQADEYAQLAQANLQILQDAMLKRVPPCRTHLPKEKVVQPSETKTRYE